MDRQLVLSVQNVTSGYRTGGLLQKKVEQIVLHDVSFDIYHREIVALVGESGSGKTTLLRCLNFLETPQVGRIVVDGQVLFDAQDKTKLSDAAIRLNRLHFGLVFQQFNLFPQYTVKRNITLAEELLAKEKIKKEGKYKEYTSFREAQTAIDQHRD